MSGATVVDGHFVSQRVSQIIHAIQEYSPELSVEWVPPGARTSDQAAFKIIHTPFGGKPYAIFHVKTEDQFDATVLKRIIAGDQRNSKLAFSEVEAAEQAAKLIAEQRVQDEMEEAHELAASILNSNKSTYKVNDNLVISDYKYGNQAVKPKIFV
jgi:hypothetical protein